MNSSPSNSGAPLQPGRTSQENQEYEAGAPGIPAWAARLSVILVWICAFALILILIFSLVTSTTGASSTPDPGPSVTPQAGTDSGKGAHTPTAASWITYSSSEYGFSFRYPPTWSLNEDSNVLNLSPAEMPELTLTIGFRRQDEALRIVVDERPPGERIALGRVPFLGKQISRHEVTRGGQVKAVLYNLQKEIQAGDLYFSLQLYAPSGSQDLNIPAGVQADADSIISSFQSSTAASTGRPAAFPPEITGRMTLLRVEGGRSQVYVMNADGSGLRRISDERFDAYWPALSPDGEKVAYAVQFGANREIVVADLHTGAVVNLTNHPANDDHPVWSPDGRRIAFQSDRLGSLDIFVMDASGADPQPLISTAAGERISGWSTDGRQILYFVEPDQQEPRWGPALKSFDLKSGQSQTMVDPQDLSGRTAAAASPDGRRLAYETILNGQELIMVINIHGARPGRVEHIQGIHPVWSPGGRFLAHCIEEAGNQRPVIHQLDDGTIISYPDLQGQITSWVDAGPLPDPPAAPIAGSDTPPAPSAGELGHLAFVRGGNIWTKHMPGEEHQITREGGYSQPRWSPSGRLLAFRGPDGRVWVHDTENLHRQALETHGAQGTFVWAPAADDLAYVSASRSLNIFHAGSDQTTVLVPSQPERQIGSLIWSPDGQWVAFEQEGGSGAGLWKVSTSDGSLVELYSQAGKLMGWTSDGKFLLFLRGVSSQTPAPDGAPLALLPVEGGEAMVIRNSVLPYPDFVQPAPAGYGSVAVVVGGGAQTWARKGLSLVISEPVGSLVPPQSAVISPAWSPAADRLAYAAMPDALLQPYEGDDGAVLMQRHLWVVTLDGSAPLQLTADPDYRDEYPQWSADGSTLLFLRLDLQGRISLWTMPSSGGPARKVMDWQGLGDLGLPAEAIYNGYTPWYDFLDWTR